MGRAGKSPLGCRFAICHGLTHNSRVMIRSKIYIGLGFVFVGLGVAGIPTPLLPTTPFLLLAAFFFARGSRRWHDWLMTHRVLSPYIHAVRDRRGLTRAQKWRISLALTVTLAVTGAFSPYWQARALAVFIWSTSLLFLWMSRSAE